MNWCVFILFCLLAFLLYRQVGGKIFLSFLLLFGGLAALWFIALTILCRGMPLPRNVVLVNCTNRVTSIHFQTEKGRGFMLAFNSLSRPPVAYPAHVRLVDAFTKQTADFEVNANYFFPLNTSSFLRPQSDYEMTVTFPSNAQPSVAISLEWIQSGRDRGKY